MRQFVWPDMGFIRVAKYHLHRLIRLPASTYALAAGFACGVSISFTPFIGFHILLAAAAAWLIRANVFAAIIGTATGNPWTFPLIWYASFHVGTAILGQPEGLQAPVEYSVAGITEQFREIFIPMLVGCVPIATVMWLIFFWLGRYLIAAYRRGKERRAHRKEINQGIIQNIGAEEE